MSENAPGCEHNALNSSLVISESTAEIYRQYGSVLAPPDPNRPLHEPYSCSVPASGHNESALEALRELKEVLKRSSTISEVERSVCIHWADIVKRDILEARKEALCMEGEL